MSRRLELGLRHTALRRTRGIGLSDRRGAARFELGTCLGELRGRFRQRHSGDLRE